MGIGFAAMFQMTWALKRVFFDETWFAKKGLTDTKKAVEESESKLKSFMTGIIFHTTDKDTVARELTHQGIDLALLKTMSKDDFFQLKGIALGEVLRIKAHVDKAHKDANAGEESDILTRPADGPEEDADLVGSTDPEDSQPKQWRPWPLGGRSGAS